MSGHFGGARRAVLRLFRLDLEIGQIHDHALLLALVVKVTEDGDGDRQHDDHKVLGAI